MHGSPFEVLPVGTYSRSGTSRRHGSRDPDVPIMWTIVLTGVRENPNKGPTTAPWS
jgi:hypothetical protein